MGSNEKSAKSGKSYSPMNGVKKGKKMPTNGPRIARSWSGASTCYPTPRRTSIPFGSNSNGNGGGMTYSSMLMLGFLGRFLS